MNGRTKIGAALSVLVLLPIGAMAAPASASAECTVERLPLPDGVDRGQVYAGDPSGRYLLGTTSDGTRMLWDGDEVSELPDPPGSSSWYAADVNSSGQVAGYSWSGGPDAGGAWRYVDGEYTWLPVLDGIRGTFTTAINSQGDIVGHGYPEDGFGQKALYWPASDPDMVRVLDGLERTGADDISDDGTILGRWQPPEGPSLWFGYVWEDPESQGRRLLGSNGGRYTRPYTLSGNLVAGIDSPNSGGLGGAVWNLDTGEITTHEKMLLTVNSAGDVTYLDAWPAVIRRADGSTAKLASLDADRPRRAAVLFERDSEIAAAGYAKDERKVKQPVVWRC